MSTPGQGHREAVGSAADEAVRLVEALQGWWSERTPPPPPADEQTEETQQTDHTQHTEHSEHASATCRYCPLCRLMSTAQARRPEVLHHLLATAESVTALLRELSRPDDESAPPPDPTARPHSGVRTVTIPVEPDDERADEPADELGGQ